MAPRFHRLSVSSAQADWIELVQTLPFLYVSTDPTQTGSDSNVVYIFSELFCCYDNTIW